MKKQFTSKSLMSRLCLMFFILMCSFFTSENAFSMPWKDTFREMIRRDNYILIKVLVYFDDGEISTHFNYSKELDIDYSEKDKVFTPLLSVKINYQGRQDQILAEIRNWKALAPISFPKCTILSQNNSYYKAEIKMEPLGYLNINKQLIKGKVAYLVVKWDLPVYIKSVKSIKISGKWCDISEKTAHTETFSEILK